MNTQEQVSKLLTQAVDLLKVAGGAANVKFSHLELKANDSYTGDELLGYIEADGLILYPMEVDQPAIGGTMKAIGWAVDAIVVDYGSRWVEPSQDASTIYGPTEKRSILNGKQEVQVATSISDAIIQLVLAIVRQNIEGEFEINEAEEAAKEPVIDEDQHG